MANHKSAEKRLRQSEKKRIRNRMVKSAVRTAIKKAKAAAAAKDPNSSQYLIEAEKAIAKAVAKGIYHKKNGSRQISVLAHYVKKQSAVVEAQQ